MRFLCIFEDVVFLLFFFSINVAHSRTCSVVLLFFSPILQRSDSESNDPAQNKTYNKTCVTSKDQPVQPTSMTGVLVYTSLDSLEAVDSTCDQRRLRVL